MSRDDKFTLHRKRPGFDDKVIGDGDLKEVLDQLHDMPSAQQKQCFVMQRGMKWNYLEAEALREHTARADTRKAGRLETMPDALFEDVKQAVDAYEREGDER